jgi:putative oxidoreductase
MKWIFLKILGQSVILHIAILIFRILVSAEMIIVHGLKKINNWDDELIHLPNPFGINPHLNLWMAVIANVAMPVLIIAGFLTRLAVLPVLSVTLIGYFVVHGNDSLAVRDVPFMYSICYLLLLITGPGKYSVDEWMANRFMKANK